VIEIELNAFEDSKLVSVVLPESLKILGPNVFKNNIALTTISLPDRINKFILPVFTGNHSLTQINFCGNFPSGTFPFAQTCDPQRKAALLNVAEGCSALNVPTIADNGLTVTMQSITLTEKVGSYQVAISYKQQNATADKVIDEGAFKVFFDDGSSEPQYGSFGKFYPGDSRDRSYVWEYLKNKTPVAISYNAGFFSKEVSLLKLNWVLPSQTCNLKSTIEAKAAAELKAQQEAEAKTAAELKAKQEAEAKTAAELKAKQEAEAKAAAELKAKEAAEAAAKITQDKAVADAKSAAEAAAKIAQDKAVADAKSAAEAAAKIAQDKAVAEAKSAAEAAAKIAQDKAVAEAKSAAEAAAKIAQDKAVADAKAALLKAQSDLAAANAKGLADKEALAKLQADVAAANAKAAADREALVKSQADLAAANASLAAAQKANRDLGAQLTAIESQFLVMSDSISTIQSQVLALNTKLTTTLKSLSTANAKIKKICSAKPKPKGC
jgi:hypothetical protein